jgi:hypothetical protein
MLFENFINLHFAKVTFFIMKIKFVTFTLLLFGICSPLHSEVFRIYLSDKGPEIFESGSKLYIETLNSLSQAALDRRAKILNPSELISIQDAPIYSEYIYAIENAGAKIIHTLKWKNYCIVRADSSLIDELRELPFVKKIETAANKYSLLSMADINDSSKGDSLYLQKLISVDTYDYSKIDYGYSFTQIKLINADKIHKLGIFGDKVKIGFLDSGFDYEKAIAFANTNVVAEYDFINNDEIVKNEEGEHPHQFHHGTLVLSVVAGFDNPKFIGMSPNSAFYLAKTEDIRSEKQIETDNFAAGIEWLESQGVDIINASLGYNKFDSSDSSFTFDELNGNTTIPAIYVNLAAQRGIIFITSVGNGGPDAKTLNSPADADSVIAVGSVQPNGVDVSKFSARGPTSTGKIKPDLTTIGDYVFCVNPTEADVYMSAKGTSVSSPLIAGAMGLMLSVFPELKPYEAKQILLKSCDRYYTPDNDYGHGIPDLFQAMIDYDIIISPFSTYPSQNFQRIFFKIKSDELIESAYLYVKFSEFSMYFPYPMKKTSIADQYVCDVPLDLAINSYIDFYLDAESSSKRRRAPYKEDGYFTLQIGDTFFVHNFEHRESPRFVHTASAFLYPNILTSGTSQSTLNFFVEKEGRYDLRVFDATGRLFYSHTESKVLVGISEALVDLTGFATGAYYIMLSHSGKTEIVPFVIVR